MEARLCCQCSDQSTVPVPMDRDMLPDCSGRAACGCTSPEDLADCTTYVGDVRRKSRSWRYPATTAQLQTAEDSRFSRQRPSEHTMPGCKRFTLSRTQLLIRREMTTADACAVQPRPPTAFTANSVHGQQRSRPLTDRWAVSRLPATGAFKVGAGRGLHWQPPQNSQAMQ